MLLAVRDAIEAAEGASLDLDALAQQLETDREAVRAALQHGIARGWFADLEVASLPASCGAAGCAPVPTSPSCRRCPLAR
ncbi:MAG: FeoC-like transcriptional regulator [Nitriliruptoraceae bacterium]